MLNNRYYEELGGVAWGILLAERLSEELQSFKIPKYDIVKTDILFQKDFVSLNICNTIEKNVRMKYSSFIGDFSINSIKGLFSSKNNLTFTLNRSNIEKYIFNNDSIMLVLEKQKSIVFQEIVTDGVFFIFQQNNNQDILEIYFNKQSYVFIKSQNKIIIETDDKISTLRELNNQVDVIQVFDVHSEISKKCNFLINTEGFICNNEIEIVQLRPTPNFEICNFNEFYTFMNFGSFNIDGIVTNLSNIDVNHENYIIHIGDEVSFWANRQIEELILEKTVVFIGKNGFKISHSLKDIPNDLKLRNRFNYIFCPKDEIDVVGKRCCVQSNGNIASIMFFEG
ncbi:MAG: hypothetical protein HXX09_16850 [Bacteroidetes bacterium]|nr:hypothetical protein [Bacteroidota bacterium]